MKTILITNQPAIAADAEAAGVSCIMVDLEINGKKERQASRNTFITTHRKEDIASVKKALKAAQLMVRINPWHEHSQAEIDHAIANGTDIVMLPMITNLTHVTACLQAIKGRVQLLPLIETEYSMRHIGEIAAMHGIPELYIGLNDLHLSLRLEFLFEPLAMGLVDEMAEKIKAHGRAFGFGGIARMGSGELPAQRILAEHERLGSSSVILSSRFCKDVVIERQEGRQQRLQEALQEMQSEYRRLQSRSRQQKQVDSTETFAIIQKIAAELKAKRQAV